MPRPAGYQAEMGAEQTQSIWQMAHVFPLLLVDCAKAGSVFYKTNSYLIRELVCGFVWGFFSSLYGRNDKKRRVPACLV